jgi:thymidylate kinase
VLQQRKREVTAAESERQRREYASCVARWPSVAVVDAARPLADVAEDVADRVIEFRLAQYRQRYEVA